MVQLLVPGAMVAQAVAADVAEQPCAAAARCCRSHHLKSTTTECEETLTPQPGHLVCRTEPPEYGEPGSVQRKEMPPLMNSHRERLAPLRAGVSAAKLPREWPMRDPWVDCPALTVSALVPEMRANAEQADWDLARVCFSLWSQVELRCCGYALGPDEARPREKNSDLDCR